MRTSESARIGGSRLAPRPTKGGELPTLARPCRQDVLSIDVPAHLGLPWQDLSFVSALRGDLEAEIAGNGQAWFCETAGCLAEGVRVEISSVLPERSRPTWRADGHMRFLRVRFFGEGTREALKLTDVGQCGAVAYLRGAVENRAGAPADAFYVSRECDARAMTFEGDPTAEMLQWHLPRLGLPTSAEVPAAPSVASAAYVALLDSGIDPGIAAAIGAGATVDFDGAPGLHEHGSGMGLLARQVAPQVGLHDLRVLGASGSGTGATLARGLDHALFESEAGAALVVNLSLGWPAELAAVAGIEGGTCRSYEDPFGAPVRYLLDIARRLDASGERRIFVSAAAGNRALDVPTELFPAPSNGLTAYECRPSGSAPAAFYPGGYNYDATCNHAESAVTRGALAVSAIDARYAPATLSLPGSETALVALGEHVTVDGIARTAPTTCTSGEAYPPPVRLPATFSGSSVSSVLVAAAAARAQQALAARGAEVLGATALGNLLYLTGVDVCRADAAGVAVRRLHVGRLDVALGTDGCGALVECARSEPAIDANLLTACGVELVQCGLEPGDAAGLPVHGCPAAPGPALSAPARPSLGCGASVRTGASVLPESSCSGSCPDEAGTDPHLVGSLGPQPGQQGCPFCVAEMDVALTRLDLSLGLNPDFAPSTQFSKPWLRITGTPKNPGSPHKVYVNLAALTSSQDWHPGAWLDLSVEVGGMDFDPGTVDVSLIMDIQTPQSSYPTTDVSPLVPKFEE